MIALPLLFSLGISYPIYLIKRFEEFGNLERMFLTNTPLAVLFSGLTTIFSFSTLSPINAQRNIINGIAFIHLFVEYDYY